VSPLAGMKGAAGYHSSILVAGEEYFFSPMGIIHSPTISSHKQNPEMKLWQMGITKYSGADLMEFLDQYFPPGHYDLLRKNCNAFSDCALYFLCEQRLDWNFRTLERLGKLADDHAGIIQSISAGEYMPNPRAVGFDVETVIEEIKAGREAFHAGEGGELDSEVEFTPSRADRKVFARDDFFGSRITPRSQYTEYAPGDMFVSHVTPRGEVFVSHITPRSQYQTPYDDICPVRYEPYVDVDVALPPPQSDDKENRSRLFPPLQSNASPSVQDATKPSTNASSLPSVLSIENKDGKLELVASPNRQPRCSSRVMGGA